MTGFFPNMKQHKSNGLYEGVGSAYNLTFKGIKATDVKIVGKIANTVYFKAKIEKGHIDYWGAENYYDGVNSEDGVKYDGLQRLEYDDNDLVVDGGVVEGSYDIMYFDCESEDKPYNVLKDEIGDALSDFNIENYSYGSGHFHKYLNDDITLSDLDTDKFYISEITINAPQIAQDINWFFENVGKFDEIFGEGEDENID